MRSFIALRNSKRHLATAAFAACATVTVSLGAQPAPGSVVTAGAGVVTTMDWEHEMMPLVPVVGLRVTSLRECRPGFDFSLTVLPQGLAYGAFVGAAEIGPAFPLAETPNARLLLRPGVGVAGAISGYGMFVIPEAYLGLGLALGNAESGALRFDASAHMLPGAGTPLLQLGVGVGGFRRKKE